MQVCMIISHQKGLFPCMFIGLFRRYDKNFKPDTFQLAKVLKNLIWKDNDLTSLIACFINVSMLKKDNLLKELVYPPVIKSVHFVSHYITTEL